MKIILFILSALGLCYLLFVAGSLMFCCLNDWNFFKLNFSNQNAKNWELPSSYKLFYSNIDNKYEIQTDSTLDLRLGVYSRLDIKAFIYNGVPSDATKFNDSVIAKYYAKLFWEHQHPIQPIDTFKPLNK